MSQRESLEAVAMRIARLALVPTNNRAYGPSKDIGRVGSGPVVGVVRHKRSGDLHVGLNIDPTLNGNASKQAETIRLRVLAHQKNLTTGRIVITLSDPLAKDGHHAEINALNQAILAEQKRLGRDLTFAELREFEMHNVWLEGNRRGTPAPRCGHCAWLSRGVTVTDSQFRAEFIHSGGKVGEIDVPDVVLPSAGGGKPPTQKGGVGGLTPKAIGGAILGGVLEAGFMIGAVALKRWFASRFLEKKWAAQARKMVENAVEANVIAFNVLILAKTSEIQRAKAAGQQVLLHVEVYTEWTDTDMGSAQTKAWIHRYEVVFDGSDPSVYWPVFQPRPSRIRQSPNTSIRRVVLQIPL